MSNPKLRIVTFNIAHGRGLAFYQGFVSKKRLMHNLMRIAKLLRDIDADVVALQEVDEDSHWTKGVNLLEVLQAEAGFSHAAFGVHNKREHPRRALAYGNGILSRYPLHNCESKAFGTSTIGEKGFLYSEVFLGGRSLPLINLHLNFRSRIIRRRQIAQVIDYIDLKEHPTGQGARLAPIVCGDFNCPLRYEKDAVAALFDYILSHEDYNLYPQKAGTFPAHLPARLPRRMIDFIFVPASLHVTHTEVLRSYLSDHRPVVVDVQLP